MQENKQPRYPENDRRKQARVPRATLIHITSLEEWGFPLELSIARTLDVSSDGLRLELNGYYPIPEDSTLEIDLSLGHEILTVRGRVAYVQELEEERSALGIQFKDIGAEVKRKIEVFQRR